MRDNNIRPPSNNEFQNQSQSDSPSDYRQFNMSKTSFADGQIFNQDPVLIVTDAGISRRMPNQEGQQPPQSLSSSVTSQASKHRAKPQPSHSSKEQRLPHNRQIRQTSEYVTTYDRVPIIDRVILKSESTRSDALQVISNLKSEFHTHHHREVAHISPECSFIDHLRLLYTDDKARRDKFNEWCSWLSDRFVLRLEQIWPQTVNVADKTFLEAIRDLHLQHNYCLSRVESV